jgi:hypothetical protein
MGATPYPYGGTAHKARSPCGPALRPHTPPSQGDGANLTVFIKRRESHRLHKKARISPISIGDNLYLTVSTMRYF